MDTDEMTMYEGVWGEMHIEYDVFKTAMDITPYLKGTAKRPRPLPTLGYCCKRRNEDNI